MVDLDYESPRKKYELIIRAASPPLWNDVRVEILVTDVNDNAPILKDFQIIFNNYKDCFPVGPFGRVPAFDADVSDKVPQHFFKEIIYLTKINCILISNNIRWLY